MSAISDGTNAAARALVDALIGALGGGPLEMVVADRNDDGTAAELGYSQTAPSTIEIDSAHGRRHPGVNSEMWELLIPADELEQAASDSGSGDVYALLGKCNEITYAGVSLKVSEVEAVCAGGDAYLYRLMATEAQ